MECRLRPAGRQHLRRIRARCILRGGGQDMAGEDRARSCSVLVVDDDEDIRETLRDVLQDEGYVVATARDGQQAMHYLAANAAQVIMLLDLMMPVKNGWMVLADLAAQPGLAARVRV